MPCLIEAQLPIEGRKPASPFRRLMIAQDTGSAIVGPARADLYWGAGEAASRIAGRIRHPGRFVMLLPREVDIAAVGREAPLPVPRPKIAGAEVKKEDGQARTRLDGAIVVPTGSKMPSPARVPKSAEVNKNGEGKTESRKRGA